MGQISDAELVQRVLDSGDAESYGELVRRYQGHVYGLAYSLLGDWAEAQDIAQETFIRAYVNLGQLRDPAKFASWLRRVAFGTCMDWLKTFRPEMWRSLGEPSSEESLRSKLEDSPAPIEQVEKLEMAEAVLEAVKRLPQKYRLPLMMFHLDGLSYEKVAEFLDVPLGTAKSLIHHAKKMLKPALTAYAPDISPMVEEVFNEFKLPAAFSERVTMLSDAISRGDVDKLRRMLKDDPSLANAKVNDEFRPLHQAVEKNQLEVVELLISAGAELEPKGWSHTPLSWAVTLNHARVANLLVAHGVPLDLWCAAGLGKLDVVQSFWDEHGKLKPNPSRIGATRYENGQQLPKPPTTEPELLGDALYIAARNGHFDVAKFLIERGADVNFRGYMGAAPLHWAAWNSGWSNNTALYDLIKSHGGDETQVDQVYGATPWNFAILCAASWGILEMTKNLLRRNPHLINARTKNGETALDILKKNIPQLGEMLERHGIKM
ncbi:MAG TPA: sigma-70 family RNA polymerase sigma factor [Tepidisphaeraceae bacterium]|jgi:RNA polymerase sigma-70 factor (ECF subfamily)|nr:sigma-70 family RNA polymerase sigma factor [Tepidisphaeraceae bacterium]